MDGYASDAASVTSRNNYAGLTATGVWLGMWLGAFTIIPTTILGIITLPFTAPIVFWKSIDQCANNTDFLMCVVAFLPWADHNAWVSIGNTGAYPLS
jgi:hypothetical protein